MHRENKLIYAADPINPIISVDKSSTIIISSWEDNLNTSPGNNWTTFLFGFSDNFTRFLSFYRVECLCAICVCISRHSCTSQVGLKPISLFI